MRAGFAVALENAAGDIDPTPAAASPVPVPVPSRSPGVYLGAPSYLGLPSGAPSTALLALS